MSQIPDIPRELSSIQVLARTILRLLVLATFAALGRQGFAKTLSEMLVLAAIYCVFVGAVRREAILGRVLTNWDEGAAYLLIGLAMASLAG